MFRARCLPQAVMLPLVLFLHLAVGSQQKATPAAREAAPDSANAAAGSRQISGDARILHLLDRLTFGPRPGDIAAVKALGIEAWINRQLQPETIEDSALEAKLRMYPAMQSSVEELLRQLPPPPVIRQIMQGNPRFSIPYDPSFRAVYQTQVALIEMRMQERAAKAADAPDQPAQPSAQPPPEAASASTAATPAGQAGGEAGTSPLAEQNGRRVPSADPAFADKQQQILADLQATGIVNLPPGQRMEKLLSMQPVERISFYRDLTLPERAALVQGLTPDQAQTVAGMFAPLQTIVSELQAAKMLRALDSNRQLQEVMTDFWFNHFNVDLRKGPLMPYYLTEYENQVLRPRALGNFEDLLVATARSRAMLVYLDNASSTGPHSQAALAMQRRLRNTADAPPRRQPPGLNENYARELMELHTLGVNGGYTQQDVIEVAKVFSGWTIERPLQGGGFVFNPRRHEPGPKVVLGHTIQEQGEGEGLQVLHILATSPATARHICQELAERFVSDQPPPSLVDRMAQTFLATHGEIRPVLRTMFLSPEFWSLDTLDAKVKTPLLYVTSATRASATDAAQPGVLALAVAKLGMPLYACQPPTGYSMQSSAWSNSGSLVERMNFAVAFSQNRLPGVRNDWDALLGPDAATLQPSRKEADLESILLHGDISQATHDAVLQGLLDAPAQQPTGIFPLPGLAREYIAPQPASSAAPPSALDRQAADAAGLLLGSPDFQSY